VTAPSPGHPCPSATPPPGDFRGPLVTWLSGLAGQGFEYLGQRPGAALDRLLRRAVIGAVSGAAMGIGAMAVALRLPLTSMLLATLLMGKPGLTVMPIVIVAVGVSHSAVMAAGAVAAERAG
jgi:hypothetical protein